MARLENKCTNCAEISKCGKIGQVVTWRNCEMFRLNAILTQKKPKYEEDKRAAMLKAWAEANAARGTIVEKRKRGRPKIGRPIDMVDESGAVLRKFKSIGEAVSVTGFSKERIYNRCNGISYTPIDSEYGNVMFRFSEDAESEKWRKTSE